jgi:thiol-disulfide isomerase/thioredoxin
MPRRPFILATVLAAVVAGSPAGLAAENHAKGPAPARIAMGETVNLADYVVPGKTTVFDFSSDYCPDCRAVAPPLEKLHATRDDIAVVEVDINRPGVKRIDWKSPVAQQYDLRSIPAFKVFGPDGKLQAEGDEAYKLVTGWFK